MHQVIKLDFANHNDQPRPSAPATPDVVALAQAVQTLATALADQRSAAEAQDRRVREIVAKSNQQLASALDELGEAREYIAELEAQADDLMETLEFAVAQYERMTG